MRILNIAVLASGSGSNLQSLIDKQNEGYFNGKIVLVISDQKDAYALVRAQKNGIDQMYMDRRNYDDNEAYNLALIEKLNTYNIDLVVLAGYLKILSPTFINSYHQKIINIHPSLLPMFGGKGYYGIKVHQAVYNQGVKVSGATVHFVEEGVDQGAIIIQKAIELDDEWVATMIQKEVLKIEHQILPLAVKYFCNGQLKIVENRVLIRRNK